MEQFWRSNLGESKHKPVEVTFLQDMSCSCCQGWGEQD